MRPDPAGRPMLPGRVDRLRPGEVVPVSADTYDIHVVENAYSTAPASASIAMAAISVRWRGACSIRNGCHENHLRLQQRAGAGFWDRSKELAA